LAVIGLLIFLHFIGILRPIEGFLVGLTNPISEFFHKSGSGISSIYGQQVDKRDHNLIIAELQKENRELLAENARLVTVEEENEYLRNQIEFRKNNNYKYVLAEIISRNDLMNNSSEEKSIIINKGSNDNLGNGMVLIDSEGVVIGKIIETRENVSKACLSIDRQCKFASAIQNVDRTSGVVEGELGLTIKMDYIPQTEILEEDDIVVTSGLEENIPRGLVLGKVSEVIRDNNSLWQKAVIEPLVDFNDLTLISVVYLE